MVAVEPRDGFRLFVTFVDGTAGEVDLDGFLRERTVEGSVFEALRDPDFFRRARVELGVVTWPNGADVAPDALYDAVAEGKWLP